MSTVLDYNFFARKFNKAVSKKILQQRQKSYSCQASLLDQYFQNKYLFITRIIEEVKRIFTIKHFRVCLYSFNKFRTFIYSLYYSFFKIIVKWFVLYFILVIFYWLYSSLHKYRSTVFIISGFRYYLYWIIKSLKFDFSIWVVLTAIVWNYIFIINLIFCTIYYYVSATNLESIFFQKYFKKNNNYIKLYTYV